MHGIWSDSSSEGFLDRETLIETQEFLRFAASQSLNTSASSATGHQHESAARHGAAPAKIDPRTAPLRIECVCRFVDGRMPRKWFKPLIPKTTAPKVAAKTTDALELEYKRYLAQNGPKPWTIVRDFNRK